MDTATANILKFWEQASPVAVEQGSQWYPSARSVAESIAARNGVSVETAAAVIAVLSPQVDWERNIAWAAATVEAWQQGQPLPRLGLGNSLKRAAVALSGDLSDVERERGSLKVANFYRNILGDVDAVTVDRHAYRAALGDIDVSPPTMTDKRYRDVADAYRNAARTIGYAPSEVQAIVWMVVKYQREAS